jgi:photosystem II stability/assembly factor-like uncharacterized protein
MKLRLIGLATLALLAFASCRNNNTTEPAATTATWTAGNFGTGATILGVNFPTPAIGYACGFDGTLLKSIDSGRTWSKLISSIVYGVNMYRVSFRDPMTGIAGGDDGILIGTTDGGTTWTKLDPPVQAGEFIRDVVYDNQRMVVVGGNGDADGVVMVSADDGQTWTRAKEALSTIYSIAFVKSSSTFTVAGVGGQIFRTTDFGITWFDESVNANGDDFTGVDFFDADHGTTVSYYGTVYSTPDGGLGWASQNSSLNTTPTNDGLLRTVKMLGTNEAWAAGESGIIIHTVNSGASWTQAPINGVSIAWNQIAARDPHTLAFVGDNGTLYWYSH